MITVSLHYLVKQMQEKLTIIDSKHVGRQNTLLTKNAVNDLHDATLC